MEDMTPPIVATAASRLGPAVLQETLSDPAVRADWRSALAEIDLPLALRPPSIEGASCLRSRKLLGEAEAAYRACLDRDPMSITALRGLAEVLTEADRPLEADLVRRRLFEVEANELGIPDAAHDESVAYFMAAEGPLDPPAAAPAAYVTALFDRYAPRFDRSLVDGLGYRGPEIVVETAGQMLGPAAAGLNVLDAGCGTGLAGPLLRRMARRLDGVDLSRRMIERARARCVYDRLDVADLTDICRARAVEYDLVAAVDVLIYVGRLEPIFAGVRRALRPQGTFAFTVERGDRPGYELRPTRRYAHHADGVVEAAVATGFEVAVMREATLRTEQSRPILSHVFVLRAAPD